MEILTEPASAADSKAARIRPSEAVVRRHRSEGVWRSTSMIDDLRRWSIDRPGAPALWADRADRGTEVVTWRQLDEAVGRYAAALGTLGVARGGVVAVQLPNWWQAVAIMFACFRRGVVLAPIMTTIRERELERMLARVGAEVAITTGVWDGHDHQKALSEISPRLPRLRHRVIVDGDTGSDEIDFRQYFDRDTHPEPAESWSDPDALSQIFFTSGTTGEPKAIMRTQNTSYAQMWPLVTKTEFLAERFYTPQSMMHAAASSVVTQVTALGGTLLLSDTWSPSRVARLLVAHAVEQVLIVPAFLDAIKQEDLAVPALRTVLVTAATVPPDLVDKTLAVLGKRLSVLWGMTEGGLLATSAGDPPGWAKRSVGRPSPATEFTLRPAEQGVPVDDDHPGRLFMRGAAVCLATEGRDSGELRIMAEHDDGWYDTGDLAVPDGRGGYRLAGRAADRIGGAFMIPVADVEAAVRTHRDVEDVAVVGHRGGKEGCAVVVATIPIDLDVLRDHLRGLGMTEWYWPTRLVQVDSLPRNAMGKVEKARLRAWLTTDPSEAR